MSHPDASIPNTVANGSPPVIPAGTPAWVTSGLVAHTLRVWQPRYSTPLSVEDAIDMILGASRLVRILWPNVAHGQSRGDSARAV